MSQTLNISLTNPASTDSAQDLLRLEQDEWGKHVGRVTREDAANAILSRLFGNSVAGLDCGLNANGDMECVIYAYPAYPALNYHLISSRGTVSRSVTETLSESEGVVFNNSFKARLKYPAEAITSTRWQGSVFDRFGGMMPPPAVSIDGDEISLSHPVSGVLIVEYTVIRHDWILIVPPSDTAVGKFDSVVYGLYRNGISWVIASPPPNADHLSANTPCGFLPGGNSGGGSVNTDDDSSDEDDPGVFKPPKNAPKKDRNVTVDYCTQEIISDSANE